VGTDNETQLTNFPACLIDSGNRATYPCFIMAPQCPSLDIAWSSFPGFPNSIATPDDPPTAIAAVIALIDSLRNCDSIKIDDNRIYVTGFSLGGEGTFDILTRRPDLFAAAMPICGIGDTAKAYLYKDIPLWIFHGALDEINSVIYSQMIVAVLKSLEANPKYTEYPDLGHTCWNTAYSDSGLIPWLFSQNKGAESSILKSRNQNSDVKSVWCSVVRRSGKLVVSWLSGENPDAVELYAVDGKKLYSRKMGETKSCVLNLPVPHARGLLLVKLTGKGRAVYTGFVSASNCGF